MNLTKLKLTVARMAVRNSFLRGVLKRRLLARARTAASRGPYVVVLSMGQNGHSYAAARAAKALGRRVLLVTDTPQVHEMLYSDALIALDPITQTDAVIAQLTAIPLEAVVVSIKHFLLPAQAAIADRFGLISVGEMSGILNNDKYAWRKALSAANVPQPDYSADPAYFEGRACIRKPRRGTASEGVVKLGPEEEKLPAQMRPDLDKLYFEELMEPDLYDVEGVVQDGQVHIMAKSREHFIYHQGAFVAHYFLFHPIIEPARSAALEVATHKTLAASQIVNGAFHIEMAMRDDGAYPIDFANRLTYERLATLSMGVDFAQAHVNCFLPEKQQIKDVGPTYVVQYFCWNAADLDKVTRLIAAYPDNVWDQIMKPHQFSGRECLGMVILKSRTRAEFDIVTRDLNLVH